MFVHDAMLEHLFCKDTFIQANMFANKVETLRLQNPETGNTYLEDEFKVLSKQGITKEFKSISAKFLDQREQ